MTRDELRKLAEAATPGPWYQVSAPWGSGTWVNAGNEDPHYLNFVCECEPIGGWVEECDTQEVKAHENAAYIAAANPQTVLGLLVEIERLEAELEGHRNFEARKAAMEEKHRAFSEKIDKRWKMRQ